MARPADRSARCAVLLSSCVLFAAVPVPDVLAADNVPPEGFVALFNGRDLTGWRGVAGSPAERSKLSADELAARQHEANRLVAEHWRVEEGVLVFDGQKVAGRSLSLSTDRDYGDFELRVDWKIGPKGDSGIYLRGTPQVQIWDPADRGIGSGGLFNNKIHPANPTTIADRPIGDWNTFRVTIRGETVTVELNGVKVVDQVVLENYYERDKSLPARGPIYLQDHGNPLYFKNIFLRELAAP